MKLEGYERIKSSIEPGYWYEEGDGQERLYADLLQLVHCNERMIVAGKPEEKWWIISLYKPIGVDITGDEENAKLLKWGVSMSYDDEDVGYEWDFVKHKIK